MRGPEPEPIGIGGAHDELLSRWEAAIPERAAGDSNRRQRERSADHAPGGAPSKKQGHYSDKASARVERAARIGRAWLAALH